MVAIIFIISCAQKSSEEISVAEKEISSETEQNDFGCFTSCRYFPEGFPKQMCEDWKAGKQIYWPDDCSVMQYSPCIKFCESEKKSGNGASSSASSSAPSNTASNIPSNIPLMPSIPSMNNFPQMPQSPADFIFHTRPPFCVEDSDYRAQIVYARPSDAPDRYQEISPKLRQWMSQANGIVNNEASKFGVTADFKVACNENEISVLNIVLSKSETELNTHDGKTAMAIVSEMKTQGYDDSKTKYMVYYDGNADGCQGGKEKCSGQFVTRGVDDRLSEDNIYNSGPDYSVLSDEGLSELTQKTHTTLEMFAPIVMLHEFSHTLGAVQSSAPHSSADETLQAGHCNDEPPQDEGGNDVMCKSESPDTIFDDACNDSGFAIHFDCNNDDYFNPKPELGSYLATHWNLGSPLNRFIIFGESAK
ncbi:MAG: hypothetical protein Q7K45_02320 [Nanoarchaeota archaeon]|nr:hypothetical protein [Nanoarchaeota archaeon]